MADDDFYAVWLDNVARVSRPKFFAMLLRRAGVELDNALLPLLVLVEMLGPIGVTELAERVGLTHSTVSRELAKLERQGLISRRPAPHDQRSSHAVVTEAGERIVAAINAARRALLDDVFDGWTAEERAVFSRLYRRFADSVYEQLER